MWESASFIHLANQLLALLFILLYLIWIELRRAREARGWTAEEAADRVGVDVRTYLGWERGEREPRPLNQLTLQRTYPELVYNPISELEDKRINQALDDLARRGIINVTEDHRGQRLYSLLTSEPIQIHFT